MVLTFPGFMIPTGSIARLIVFIRPTVPSPSSSTKSSSFPILASCSPAPRIKAQVSRVSKGLVKGYGYLQVRRERELDYTVHETAYGIELLIGLKEKESVKISGVIN